MQPPVPAPIWRTPVSTLEPLLGTCGTCGTCAQVGSSGDAICAAAALRPPRLRRLRAGPRRAHEQAHAASICMGEYEHSPAAAQSAQPSWRSRSEGGQSAPESGRRRSAGLCEQSPQESGHSSAITCKRRTRVQSECRRRSCAELTQSHLQIQGVGRKEEWDPGIGTQGLGSQWRRGSLARQRRVDIGH